MSRNILGTLLCLHYYGNIINSTSSHFECFIMWQVFCREVGSIIFAIVCMDQETEAQRLTEVLSINDYQSQDSYPIHPAPLLSPLSPLFHDAYVFVQLADIPWSFIALSHGSSLCPAYATYSPINHSVAILVIGYKGLIMKGKIIKIIKICR